MRETNVLSMQRKQEHPPVVVVLAVDVSVPGEARKLRVELRLALAADEAPGVPLAVDGQQVVAVGDLSPAPAAQVGHGGWYSPTLITGMPSPGSLFTSPRTLLSTSAGVRHPSLLRCCLIRCSTIWWQVGRLSENLRSFAAERTGIKEIQVLSEQPISENSQRRISTSKLSERRDESAADQQLQNRAQFSIASEPNERNFLRLVLFVVCRIAFWDIFSSRRDLRRRAAIPPLLPPASNG
ncbi:hypothetical protein CEXT_68001 [Caerostris extrusa]|uniref:Uncharacterized protein n=1 Tax=Caerostris extrusa TaxID=172846 RepID=A0AAV4VTX1_CAEEX|nr:hypothetical protein CEXT_68001 [Caerostris extrusa]